MLVGVLLAIVLIGVAVAVVSIRGSIQVQDGRLATGSSCGSGFVIVIIVMIGSATMTAISGCKSAVRVG